MTTILVIEDEAPILENILEVLEIKNYQGIAATNGREGVELARQYLPDLIVCDIMMPELDGYGVLLNLRTDPATSSIPFIFLTARSDRPAIRYGMELGADDYLTKPFTPPELLSAVGTRLERRVAVAREYEKKMDDLRSGIMLMLPHEFRTPLTAILGYSELMLDGTDQLEPEQVHDMVARINKAGKRLYHLIENFLVYAQIGFIKSDVQRRDSLRKLTTESPKLIIESQATLKAQEIDREADIQLAVDDAASVQMSLDSLQKIVRELVDNACKFSMPGTPVEVCAVANEDAYILSIRDYGRGMTAQEIADIGAYQQFDRKIREQQGSGLGLSIARGLVDLHGGTIAIESVPGEGTTVSVTLVLGQASKI